MSSRKLVFILAIALCVWGVSLPVWSADDTVKKGNRYTVYNKTAKCQMVCKAPKPVLAILEDGLAYALDLPLALLSPITCPIVRPIMDRVDPVEKRTYRGK
jgi:hypothetical protein